MANLLSPLLGYYQKSYALEAMRPWSRAWRSAIYGILRDAVPDFGGQAA
jgi:hypothetical protein